MTLMQINEKIKEKFEKYFKCFDSWTIAYHGCHGDNQWEEGSSMQMHF